MTNSEMLLRKIIGVVRADIKPFSCALDVATELLFEQGYSMNDILITKHIYPETAKRLGRKAGAVSKSIERLTPLCWDALTKQELVGLYIGRSQKYCPTPRDLLVYFAVYIRLGCSFFEATEQCPELLFHSPTNMDFSAVHKDIAEKQPGLGLNTATSMLLFFEQTGGYTAVPVCSSCMAALEQERRSFCNRCNRCQSAHFAYADINKLAD